MAEYVIFTDSSCDLPAQLAKEMELEVNNLSFSFISFSLDIMFEIALTILVAHSSHKTTHF